MAYKTNGKKVRAALIGMGTVFRSLGLPLKTKILVLLCYTVLVLLHGAEAWSLSGASVKKLQTFAM